MNTFQPETVRVLTACGWQVTDALATQIYTPMIEGHVKPDGSWEVRNNGYLVSWGKESHPALAACDANECAWIERSI